jgi:ribosome-associated translation inhibitor RaiA
MRSGRIRHLVVLEKGHLIGVISDRDLGGPNGAAIRKGRRVTELMSKKVATATSMMTLRQAANLMRGRMIGSLPVVDDGDVVGIVTATDVLDELGRESRQSNKNTKRIGGHSSTNSRRTGKAGEETGSAPESVASAGRANSTHGRNRSRQPDSPRRAPFPARLPRSGKAKRGRTTELLVPAYIRSVGLDLDKDDRAYIRRKLGLKLGKFARAIERVSVRIEDINGPRGGKDKACRIKAVLQDLPSVVVESRSAALQTAVDGALGQIEKTVRRTVDRRQTMKRRTKTPTQRQPVEASL